MAIRTFGDKGTEDINYGYSSKAARRTPPIELREKAKIKLARLHAAESLNDLATLPGNASPGFWLNLQKNWELGQVDVNRFSRIEQLAA